MQITVQVSDKMRRHAESHGLPIVDFHAMPIGRGLEAVANTRQQAGVLAKAPASASASAMCRAFERVRAFRRALPIAEDRAEIAS